jgi:V/A-type H+-transporting ATPase subunit C
MNEYYYGVGRIRALEAKMLTLAQVARMAAASDFQSAFGVLSETPYAEHLTKIKHPFDFEEICALELVSLKNLLDYLAPQNQILDALFRKYDFLNLKILIRGYFSGLKETELYSKAGTIAFEKLKRYVFEGIKEIDHKEIREAVDLAKSIYEQNKDPQAADIALDKQYFLFLKQVCDASPSPLIKEMAQHQIDLTNIKILFRSQELKKDKKFLEGALLEPGMIGKDILLELHDKNPQDISSRLSFTRYFPALAEGIEYFSKNKSFYVLEKLADNYILNQFRKAKYLSSGIEPLVGFYLAKEAEIKTVRFILICRRTRIGSEQIKNRLRVSYA